jgi:hypothetical protein
MIYERCARGRSYAGDGMSEGGYGEMSNKFPFCTIALATMEMKTSFWVSSFPT